MLETVQTILRNALIFTAVFMILFAILEFSRVQDIIVVFQNIFKEKYLKTYIVVFVSALILQAVLFPLIKLIF